MHLSPISEQRQILYSLGKNRREQVCILWFALHDVKAATTIHFKRSNLRRNPMHCDKNLNAERKEIILLKNDRLKLQLAQFSLSRVVRISGCYFFIVVARIG